MANKFGAIMTVYNGRRYHSKAESLYARDLDLRQKAGDILHWRPQVSYPIMVNGDKICTYVMDFVVTYPDGVIELVEIKGMETAVFKLKAKLLRATYLKDHPEIIYTIVRT